jgi:hypothetical protein
MVLTSFSHSWVSRYVYNSGKTALKMHDKDNTYDLYKHSPLRYLGYANELGEAFRSFLPKSVVVASYVVASGYALGDAVDKGYTAYKKPDDKFKKWNVADKTSDTLIWQVTNNHNFSQFSYLLLSPYQHTLLTEPCMLQLLDSTNLSDQTHHLEDGVSSNSSQHW